MSRKYPSLDALSYCSIIGILSWGNGSTFPWGSEDLDLIDSLVVNSFIDKLLLTSLKTFLKGATVKSTDLKWNFTDIPQDVICQCHNSFWFVIIGQFAYLLLVS